MGAEKKQKNRDLVDCGQRIMARRKELGLSRNRLSESVGISEKDLAQIERGEHGCRTGRLAAIAATLNVTLDYLWNGEQRKSVKLPECESPGLQRLFMLFDGCTEEDANSLFQLNLDFMKYIKRSRGKSE